MKQIIPFEKEITLKNKVKELTSISLDNDLQLKGEDLITGNFYIKGSYKTLINTEEYSYKIPCEIAISDDYDTYDASIDIDDFNYEVDEDTLKISISVAIDNLIRKEEILEEQLINENRCIDEKELEELEEIEEKRDKEEQINIIYETKEENDIKDTVNIIEKSSPELIKLNNEDNYLTYSVYLVREQDTLNDIITKYKTTKEEIYEYNEISELKEGIKLIIPNHD